MPQLNLEDTVPLPTKKGHNLAKIHLRNPRSKSLQNNQLSFGKPGVPAPGKSHLIHPAMPNSIKVSSLNQLPTAPLCPTWKPTVSLSQCQGRCTPSDLKLQVGHSSCQSSKKIMLPYVAPCPWCGWPDSSGPGFPQRSVVSRTPVGAHSDAPGFKRRILLMRSDLPTSNLQLGELTTDCYGQVL